MRSFRFLCARAALTTALATAMLGLSAQGAWAEEEEARPEIEVGIHGGGHFFSDTNRLGRDPTPTDGNVLRHSGAIGARVGLGLGVHFMPEVELLVIPTQSANELARVNVLAWRAQLLYHIIGGRVRPFILAGGGALSGFSRNQDVVRDGTIGMFHAGAGIKFDFTEHFGMRLDARILLPPEVKQVMQPDWEALLGFYLKFGLGKAPPKDTDGDGVMDPDDKCPAEKGLRENAGCPDKDSDGDTVVDRLDKCPADKGLTELGGCPDKDDDGDGVLNLQDKCPAQAGVKELAGCPDKDDDGDGVLNLQDKCPTEPGVAELAGCPDKDGDGIADAQDKCVDKPETKNGFQDDDGCPDELPKALQRFTGAVQGVAFEAGRDVLTQGSYKVLDQAAQALKDNPSVKLEIAGHTDSSGDAAKNRELSQRRADAVRRYLMDKGVAEDRLQAVGCGPDKPVADNGTPEGRGKNRRVEFTLQPAR